ncbi:MAG: hypothetical protein H7A49_16875 [Akkermansiaceae bacterium]|nr:hypothetical protein [Akkermansiaceae bacterium]MCP5545572.1 hypothetical protein [Akkermansiaceae bacterium]MCP5548425.1 hypothetical protein [Akkermansiaceae bacterium]
MKIAQTIITLAAATLPASATVVARFNSFTHAADVAVISTDASAQTGWTTTALTDQATGLGALSATNQSSTNRKTNDFGSTPTIQFSSNRESDAGIPTGTIGESTWSTFTVSASSGNSLDFDGQVATADTFAEGTGLGGTVSADWTLYFSLDGGTSWTSLGAKTGASIGGSGGESAATAVSWDLTAIGTQTSVSFLLDPVSTGSTNGNVSQRGVAVGNIEVNAVVLVPEVGSAFLGSLGLFGLLRRRR